MFGLSTLLNANIFLYPSLVHSYFECSKSTSGWTSDCSLHPRQWNFSGKRTVAPLLGLLRLKALYLEEFGQIWAFLWSCTVALLNWTTIVTIELIKGNDGVILIYCVIAMTLDSKSQWRVVIMYLLWIGQ